MVEKQSPNNKETTKEIVKEKEHVEEPNFQEEIILPKKRAEWKVKLETFLENYGVVGFMAVVTIYSLFFDDIRAAAF